MCKNCKGFCLPSKVDRLVQEIIQGKSNTKTSFWNMNIKPETADEKYEIFQRIMALIKCTRYNMVQVNGQRIFGGPPTYWTGPIPSKDTEVCAPLS